MSLPVGPAGEPQAHTPDRWAALWPVPFSVRAIFVVTFRSPIPEDGV